MNARCYVCGRVVETATWERPVAGYLGVTQTMRVFKPHPDRGQQCLATGHAVLPEQKTPGRR